VILLLRGAPGAGKSTTAAALSACLGAPPRIAVVEVDDLRGDLWHVPSALRLDDGERHHLALAQAARIALALLGAGVRSVVVVDTFSARGVEAFRAALRCSTEVREVVLHAEPEEHARRLETREGAHAFRDARVALAMARELLSDGLAREHRAVRTTGASAVDVASQIAAMLDAG
jgi:predicted kinase